MDIFSEELSPNTTADGAAGIFGLYLLGKTPIDKQVSILHSNVIEIRFMFLFANVDLLSKFIFHKEKIFK